MTQRSTSKPTPHPDALAGRITRLVEPLCVAHGVDLVEVAWVGGRILRVTIERRSAASQGAQPTGWGVTLDDCAELSRDVSRALDQEDFIAHAYSLEVSSPGLERPIRTADDFRRFVGMAARVKLSRPAPDGQRLLRGRIEALDGAEGAESLRMNVDHKDITVPLATVTDASLVYELPAAPKQRPSGRGTTKTRQGGRNGRKVTSRSS
jgi:ribosome maturation factor RimP